MKSTLFKQALHRAGWSVLTVMVAAGLGAAAPEALAQAALSDKKRAGGKITLVVPKRIGDCALVDIPVEQLADIFRAGMEGRA